MELSHNCNREKEERWTGDHQHLRKEHVPHWSWTALKILYKQKWPNNKELLTHPQEGNSHQANLKINDIEPTVPFWGMLSVFLPSGHLWLLSGTSSSKFRAEVCWAVPPKTEFGNNLHKVKKQTGNKREIPWAPMPQTHDGAIYPIWGEPRYVIL